METYLQVAWITTIPSSSNPNEAGAKSCPLSDKHLALSKARPKTLTCTRRRFSRSNIHSGQAQGQVSPDALPHGILEECWICKRTVPVDRTHADLVGDAFRHKLRSGLGPLQEHAQVLRRRCKHVAEECHAVQKITALLFHCKVPDSSETRAMSTCSKTKYSARSEDRTSKSLSIQLRIERLLPQDLLNQKLYGRLMTFGWSHSFSSETSKITGTVSKIDRTVSGAWTYAGVSSWVAIWQLAA